MAHRKADVFRWMRGQRLAGRRITSERRKRKIDLETELARVEELRGFADDLGTIEKVGRSRRQNLEFHFVWRRVRRAFRVG